MNGVKFPELTDRTPTGGFMQDGIMYSDKDSEDEDEEKTTLSPSASAWADRKQNDSADGSINVPDGPQPLAGPAIAAFDVLNAPVTEGKNESTADSGPGPTEIGQNPKTARGEE
jgi:hypothetical protein